MFGIVVGLLILMLLVVAHELGHATAAHRSGVKVEEFGVGFPPKVYKKKLKNGTLFSLNWLPLGGFVKLKGEYDSAPDKDGYGAASYWNKTKILLAGVAVNWLLAAFLFTILAFLGMPKILPNQVMLPFDTLHTYHHVEITSIVKDHAAEKAGFMVGDSLIKLNDQAVTNPDEMIKLSRQYSGEEVEIIYRRDGQEKVAVLTLGTDAETGIFGAGLNQKETLQSSWSAPILGVATTVQLSWATVEGIGNLFVNLGSGIVNRFSSDEATRKQADESMKQVGDSVAGPIGILGTIFPSAQKAGLVQLTLLTAIISLSLAVMNALPIPALDGGRWLLMTIFKLRKKKLTKQFEEKVQTIGFVILMGLIILVTIADVAKII